MLWVEGIRKNIAATRWDGSWSSAMEVNQSSRHRRSWRAADSRETSLLAGNTTDNPYGSLPEK